MNAMPIENIIKKLSNDEITKIVTTMKFDINVNKKAEEVCYDRYLCEALGIDYNKITSIDFARAYVYCYWRETDG